MKAYTIALFLLLFQLSAALIEASAIFPNSIFAYDNSSLNQWKQDVKSTNFLNAGQQDNDQNAELIQSKGIFSKITSALNVGNTLNNLGIPQNFADLLSIPVYFIWLIAVAQFIRGVSFTNSA